MLVNQKCLYRLAQNWRKEIVMVIRYDHKFLSHQEVADLFNTVHSGIQIPRSTISRFQRTLFEQDQETKPPGWPSVADENILIAVQENHHLTVRICSEFLCWRKHRFKHIWLSSVPSSQWTISAWGHYGRLW